MKAEITKLGVLEISTISELESYALSQWVRDNIHECTGEIKKENISFDWSFSKDKADVNEYD